MTDLRTEAVSSPILFSQAVETKLRSRFQGERFLPDEAGYDGARQLWNARFDKRPSLVAQCTGVADVIEIVRFAREHGLGAAVRSGRHDLTGRCVTDGEISIDLSQMRGIRVDPVRGTVRAQAGARWRDRRRNRTRVGLQGRSSVDSSGSRQRSRKAASR